MIWKPWTLFTVALAGWMSRQQQEVIAYLREENRILRENLGRKRILLSIEQKRRLATKGKTIGRELLAKFGTLFSPDTILRWHRHLIARKYDGSANKGLNHRRPVEPAEAPCRDGPVVCRERLGGLLKSYHREAAQSRTKHGTPTSMLYSRERRLWSVP